jgi:hypothetical protein
MFSKARAAPLAAFALIAAAPITTAPVAGQDHQSGSASRSVGAEAGKAERKTCKRFENIASRMRATTLCLTKSQWREFNAAQE